MEGNEFDSAFEIPQSMNTKGHKQVRENAQEYSNNAQNHFSGAQKSQFDSKNAFFYCTDPMRPPVVIFP